ncbi:hypothetical protein HPB50_026307 [Hyalomma asiaticum]|uniref:Uncharacterized protein n=1 Tax=Hyalomma asiaticum TaxID=266040 RepID=A0ACB7SZZ9_HYAAI|nr:hypothetical protein HPB50_026307 [Hyalomma asiaticum]
MTHHPETTHRIWPPVLRRRAAGGPVPTATAASASRRPGSETDHGRPSSGHAQERPRYPDLEETGAPGTTHAARSTELLLASTPFLVSEISWTPRPPADRPGKQ